jgi:hypothetical protein
MQNKHSRHSLVISVVLFLFLTSCKNASDTVAGEKEAAKTAGVSMTDMNQVRSEIQAIKNQWAEGMNKKNYDQVMALYTDDAVSFPNNATAIWGKESLPSKLSGIVKCEN